MLDQRIITWVADSAAQFVTSNAFDPEQLHFQLIHAEDREVYRIDYPGWSRFLVLKVWCIDEAGNPIKDTGDSIRGEYEKTQQAHHVWTRTRDDGLFIAEPVAVSDSLNAILLTGCPGNDFSKYLNLQTISWPLKLPALSKRFRAAGVWLGAFHSGSVGMESGGQYVATRIENLARMLDAIRSEDLDENVRASIWSKISRSLQLRKSLPVALIHGNFALRNLLVSSTSISAIDFEECRRECTAYDVGQFVAEILVRGFVPTFPNVIVRRFVREFLAGYETEAQLEAQLDAELVDAYLGYHLIAFYFEHVRRRRLNFISRLRRNHIKRELEKWLR